MQVKVALLLAGAVALVGGLATLDMLLEGEPFAAGDFAFELLDRAVLVVAITAIAWSVGEVRDLRREQIAMRADLARAVARGRNGVRRAATRSRISARRSSGSSTPGHSRPPSRTSPG
jgi:hypothetical protein